MLKRHILSRYITDNKIITGQCYGAKGQLAPTMITKSEESSDIDQLICADPTILTHADFENSDIDEFVLRDPTCETNAIESSDSDEILFATTMYNYKTRDAINRDCIDPTKQTYTIELTDDDDFLFP